MAADEGQNRCIVFRQCVSVSECQSVGGSEYQRWMWTMVVNNGEVNGVIMLKVWTRDDGRWAMMDHGQEACCDRSPPARPRDRLLPS